VRVLVCGTNYGSSYLRALYDNESGLRLAGVLARSERSRALAAQCGAPFFTAVDDVPRGAIDAAVVAISGESGNAIVTALLERGVHVLAEHPVYVAEVAAHRRTARAHRAVYHVNAHYSDIDGAATFVAAFRAARERSRLLFVNVMTNPRALYSAIEIVARAVGSLRPLTLARASADFFDLAWGTVAGVPLTLQKQTIVSEIDDGSSCWISHRITAGFDDGVLTLGEAPGPVEWIPALPSLRQLQSDGASYNARPLCRVLAAPPPTYADYVSWGRDRANRIALARFAAEVASGVTPPEQSDEHLLGVSELWEAMLV
jgi:thiazolinyl imide reductase